MSAPHRSNETAGGSEVEGGAAPKPRVLVVDDEPMNRAVLRRILAHEYEVVDVGSAPAALAELEKSAFDLVLLDVMMHPMSGYDACRKIKAISDRPFLPVVLLTSLDTQEDRNEGLAAGADDFLTKPFDRRELELRCRALVRMRRAELIIRRQVNELAELQQLKDDLVSLVVHDVRNPLSGLLGSLQTMEEDLARGKPVAKEDVATAQASAVRIRTLVEEVLQVRVLEERELPLRVEQVRLSSVAEEAIASLSGDAKRRGVGLVLSVDGDPTASVDRELLRRAIENLIANALKYSPRAAAVDISVRAADAHAVVEIADRGRGIPDDAKRYLFEKFGSVEAQRDEARRGFGLGLYLVKLTVSAHRGTVSVHDRPGGGALFRVSIPLHPS